MTERQKPRRAATVILLRDAEPRGLEVFLTRRRDDMAFLGGMYCFPGGTVRKEDCSASMLRQSLLESDGLLCHASKLAYFSYWRTPSQFSLRFDTRFFLAALPADQSPLPASPEVAHSLWLTPDRALHLFAKDELPMIFPTFASLRTLADFDSQESVFKEFRHGK